jgi:hypothetical protein
MCYHLQPPTWQTMSKVVLSFVLILVFPQAQAGLELLQNEKRSVFDIIPDGTKQKLTKNNSVKCFRDETGKCHFVLEKIFKQSEFLYSFSDFENKLKQKSRNIPSKHELKMEIKQYFKTKNTKRPSFPSKDELKREIKQYFRSLIIRK